MNEKDDPNCTTCTDFKEWFSKQSSKVNNGTKFEKNSSKKEQENIGKIIIDDNDDMNQINRNKQKTKTKTKTTTTTSDLNSEYYEECPMFRDQFGKAAWSYLHTMAAHYPSKPTDYQKTKMIDFIQTFALFFPANPAQTILKMSMKKSNLFKSYLNLSLLFKRLLKI